MTLGDDSKVREREVEEEVEGAAELELEGSPDTVAMYVGADTTEAEADSVLLRDIGEGV